MPSTKVPQGLCGLQSLQIWWLEHPPGSLQYWGSSPAPLPDLGAFPAMPGMFPGTGHPACHSQSPQSPQPGPGVSPQSQPRGGVTSSGDSVHLHRPRPAQGYISHMTCMCIYRMYTLQGRGGTGAGRFPHRSLSPKAWGAPAGISWPTLTRAPLSYQPQPPRPVSPAAPGAYAVVLLLSCCRLRLLAPI